MSLTLLGCVFVVASAAISTLVIFTLRSDVARRDLRSRLRSSSWRFGQGLRGTAGTLIVPAAVFLLVAGIGAAISYLRDPPEATGSGDAMSSLSRSGSDGEMLARLKDYTRSIGTEEPASVAAAGELLPDVSTMIERLAARLETTPEDIKGWRMLGWSYFHTGRYEQAAAAYARAVELDPNSAELKALVRGGQGEGLRDNLVFANRRPSATVVTDYASRKIPSPKRCLRTRATLQSERWSMAWQIAWRVLRETSRAGLASCALELCLVRERSRQQRSARRSRSSRTTRQHRARLRPRRLSSA